MKKKFNLGDAGFENMFLVAFDAGKKFDENLLAELAPFSPSEQPSKFFVDQIAVPFGYVTLLKVSDRYFLITMAGDEFYSEDECLCYANNHPYQPVEVTPNMRATHWFDCKIKKRTLFACRILSDEQYEIYFQRNAGGNDIPGAG